MKLDKNKFLTFLIKLKGPKGELIDGRIIIKDENAMFECKDKGLLKKLYDLEKANGNNTIKYVKKFNVLVQRYKGMDKEQIKNKLAKELRKGGGKLIENGTT